MAKRDDEKVDLNSVMSTINAALESSDIASICKAVGDAVMLHNVSDIARKSGLKRTSLYRAFRDAQRHPNFSTVLSVLDAIGFQLKVVRSRNRRSRPTATLDNGPKA
jgi:probable addiction module antidote protein